MQSVMFDISPYVHFPTNKNFCSQGFWHKQKEEKRKKKLRNTFERVINVFENDKKNRIDRIYKQLCAFQNVFQNGVACQWRRAYCIIWQSQ